MSLQNSTFIPRLATRREQEVLPFQEYRIDGVVDELKPHNIFGTNIPCLIRRGVIVATFRRGRSATIRCECRTIVKEAV